MIIPLNVATRGYIPIRSTLTVATRGYLGVSEVFDERTAGGAGGFYGARRKKLRQPIEKYEKRIERAIKEEIKDILAEQSAAEAKLVRIEKDDEYRLGIENEIELQILILKDVISSVNKELIILSKQEMEIRRLAEILRDDEEILMMISSAVSNKLI